MLRVASYCLPKQNLITLYQAFFQSHISFALLFWSSANSTHLLPIRLIQKTAIRVTSGTSYRSHSASLSRKISVQLFDDYVSYCKLVFMFKVYRTKLDCVSSLNVYFLPAIIINKFFILSSNTRQNNIHFCEFRCNLHIRNVFYSTQWSIHLE